MNRVVTVVPFLTLAAVFTCASFAHAATRPATAADCAVLAMTAAGAPCTVGTTPYDPDSPFTGDEVGRATAFLLERNGTGSRGVPGCYRKELDRMLGRPEVDRILKLNPQFRVGLAKALAEIERLYGGGTKAIVQSGYRCDDTYYHPRGCAADIIWPTCLQKFPPRSHGDVSAAWRCSSDHYYPSTDSWSQPEQQWIDANGKKSPYNIHLRIRGKPEGHHVEPVNTEGCATGPTVTPGGAAPSAGISNLLRQSLGQQQPLAAQPQPQPQPVFPPQPNPQTQPITDAFTQPTTSPVTPSSTPPKATGPSIADQLEKLAFGDRSTSTVVATSLPLVIDGTDVGGVVSTKKDAVQPSGEASRGLPFQNTFISNDLVWGDSATELGVLARILNSIARILRTMLALVQPFGRPESTYAEHEPEHEY